MTLRRRLRFPGLSFSKRKRYYVALGIIAVAVISTAVLAVVYGTTPVRRLADQLVYGNRNHYLPCEAWPPLDTVTSVLSKHADAVREIENVNPGFVMVSLDSAKCPGKADIIIMFGGHNDRVAIEAIIGGETFFGVPYRLINV